VPSELLLTDRSLKPIADKVRAGERLSFDEGVQLYRSPDLLGVGWLANYVRRKKARQRHLLQRQSSHQFRLTSALPTANSARSAANPNSPGAYTYALDEIYQRADQASGKAQPNSTLSAACTPTCPSNISSNSSAG